MKIPITMQDKIIEMNNTEKSIHKKNESNDLFVVLFDKVEYFEQLKKHWQDLAKRADMTIYMSYEWSYLWWKYFGQNEQRTLSLVTIWDGTKLVGIAPFYIGTSSVGSLTIGRRLQLIGSGGSPNEQLGYKDDYGISDFLDVIVDPDYSSEVAGLLATILKSNHLNVTYVSFSQSRDDSFVLNYLYPALEKIGLTPDLQHVDTCAYIDLEGESNLKAYIKQLDSSSARRRLRQTLRAVGEENGYVIEEAKTWKQVVKATDAIIELHQNRWNKLGFPGIFHDDRFTGFFRELVREAFDNGWIWFKEAQDSNGTCAGRMLLLYNGRYFDYISGFDDERESSKYRPGIGLLLNAVNDAIEGGVKSVELLRGQESYKYDFTSKSLKNWRISLRLKDTVSPLNKVLRPVFGVIAELYMRASRESKLIKTQFKQVGAFGAIPAYFLFRWNSIKLKMDRR